MGEFRRYNVATPHNHQPDPQVCCCQKSPKYIIRGLYTVFLHISRCFDACGLSIGGMVLILIQQRGVDRRTLMATSVGRPQRCWSYIGAAVGTADSLSPDNIKNTSNNFRYIFPQKNPRAPHFRLCFTELCCLLYCVAVREYIPPNADSNSLLSMWVWDYSRSTSTLCIVQLLVTHLLSLPPLHPTVFGPI